METVIQDALFQGNTIWFTALAIYVAGIMTSFTPCVYPILPITVSMLSEHAKNFRQSLVYTFIYITGLSIVYSLLGYFAASTGHLFGRLATHPVTLFMAASMCLVMAVWMLGYVHIPSIPVRSFKNKHNPKLTMLISGGLSGMVMAPCTSPILGMLLLFVASEQSPKMGALYLFLFSLGMSSLLIVGGISSSLLTKLPKSGPWLNCVKYILAALLLLVALSFYSQITF